MWPFAKKKKKKIEAKGRETDLGAVGMRKQQATMKGLSRDIKVRLAWDVIVKLAKSASPKTFPRTVAPVNCQWAACMLRFLVVCNTRVCVCVCVFCTAIWSNIPVNCNDAVVVWPNVLAEEAVQILLDAELVVYLFPGLGIVKAGRRFL
jgi:hypothetical protein